MHTRNKECWNTAIPQTYCLSCSIKAFIFKMNWTQTSMNWRCPAIPPHCWNPFLSTNWIMRKTEMHSNCITILTYIKLFPSKGICACRDGGQHTTPQRSSLIKKLFKYSKYRMIKENSTMWYKTGAHSAAWITVFFRYDKFEISPRLLVSWLYDQYLKNRNSLT